MRPGRLHASIVVALLFAGVPGIEGRAHAQGVEVDATTRARAAKKFRAGEAAFKKHKYKKAAKAFEEAYEIAPHPAPLFNAARAYEKAGDLVTAANLCAIYLRDAPSDDKRQSKARALLADLTPKVGRIQVEAEDGDNVEIDGRSMELEVTYVDPGDHTVSGEFDGEIVERQVEVVAGSLVKVSLGPEVELEEEGGDEGVVVDGDEEREPEPGKGKGLRPVWFWTGAAATAVLGGATVWSGLDTNSARDDFDKNPTQTGYDDGVSKQKRTNLLFGLTAVVGVGTGVVGAFFTDWSGESDEKEAVGFSVGPGSVHLSGRF